MGNIINIEIEKKDKLIPVIP